MIARDGLPVILPLHPRTRNRLKALGLALNSLTLIKPVSYLDMLLLEKQATLILTDSGGVQKEAFFFQVPCVTLRNETEWVELVENGFNILAGAKMDRIINAYKVMKNRRIDFNAHIYGDGQVSKRIIEKILAVKER